VLLLTSRRFTELPYFLSLSPIVKGFFISPTGNCGANYFVNFLRQEARLTPFTLAEHLAPGNKVIALDFDDPQSQGEVLAKARAFFLWCLGDPQDPSNIQRSRQLEDSLNELLANVVRHGCKATTLVGPINAEIHLGFDGVLVGIRVKDPFGSMRRQNLLESIAADQAALRSLGDTEPPSSGRGYKMILEKKQRVLVNLQEDVSTEVICITRLSSRNLDDLGQPSSLEIRSWPRFCA
jgi:anti-sigma regulatory factor (Ser/Thr protein kinase)